MIRNLLLASAATIALSGAAFAADMPSYPAEAAAVGPDWSGFYVGVNAGWAKLEAAWTDVHGYWNAVDGEVRESEPDGFTAGGQVGYNWMYGPVLLGAEADINFSDTNETDDGLTFDSDITRDNGMDWFATIRGRLGYAFGPAVAYVTGGLAIAGFEHQWIEDGYPGGSWEDFGDTELGWTVGGGIEFLVTENISIKAEALFLKFDDVSAVNTESEGYEMQVEREAIVARAGLNYHF